MNSFNVYGQTTETIGGNTPVWLGTVKPIPVGAKVQGPSKKLYPAGTMVTYCAATREVISILSDGFTAAESDDGNAYLYNDVYIPEDMEDFEATCAIVMHHPEGLLIERVYPGITEEQIAVLQSRIPGVLLVRG